MNERGWGTGAGARLKSTREERGLDLGVLAAQLKVPVSRLEALEAGDWQALPDGPYARGLAKAVCRVLQMDAQAVLEGMPGASSNALERVSVGLNQPFKEGGTQTQWPRWGLALVALVLAVAAALFWGLPTWGGGGWSFRDEPPAAEAPDMPRPAAPAASAPTKVAPIEPASAPAELASAPVTVLAPVVAPAPAGSAVQAAVAPTAAPATAGLLRVTAQQATWLSVTDARGQSLVARLVAPGEVVVLDPVAPARITLGNAPGARLEWRGQVQDLSAYAQSRVARLELP